MKKILGLLFVIVGLGCIAGSNFLPKEEETTPTKKEEKKEPESAVVEPTGPSEQLTVDSKVVTDLLKTYGLSNGVDITFAWESSRDDNNNYDMSSYKATLAFYYSQEKEEMNCPADMCTGKTKYAKLENIKVKYKELFNEEFDESSHYFNIKDGIVLLVDECCADTTGYMADLGICSEKVDSIKQEGNTLILYTSHGYYDDEGKQTCLMEFNCMHGNTLSYHFKWDSNSNKYYLDRIGDDITKEQEETIEAGEKECESKSWDD